MRTLSETEQINKALGRAGLATLDNPTAFFEHFGWMVQDHDHLRSLLNRCEPTERRSMYESITPHLRFTAKPLDVYISELGDIADRRQMPVMQEDGTLRAWNKPVIGEEKTGDLAKAQRIIAETTARKTLTVVCAQCTKEASFPGFYKQDCLDDLRKAGWVYRDGKEYCPDCSAN